MKKLVSLFLALLMALQLLPAMAGTVTAETQLLEQFALILDVRETVYAAYDRVLTAVDRFLQERTYETLVEARIVCDEALDALADVEVPAFAMSDDALIDLIGRGVDTSAMEIYASDLDECIGDACVEIISFKNILYLDVFLASEQERTQRTCERVRRQLEVESTYDTMFVNAILMPLTGQAATDAFVAAMPGRWPVTCAHQQPWTTSEADLRNSIDALMTEYEAMASEAAADLGEATYAVENFAGTLTDAEAIRADVIPVSGMPVMLPLPAGWLLPWTMTNVADADRTGLPETLILRDAEVTLQMFFDYGALLEDYGATVYKRTGSDGEGWTLAMVKDARVLLMKWYPDNTVAVGYDPRGLSLELPLCVLYAR